MKVIANLAHKGSSFAQLGQHSQYIARGTTGIGLKNRVALLRLTVLGKVN